MDIIINTTVYTSWFSSHNSLQVVKQVYFEISWYIYSYYNHSILKGEVFAWKLHRVDQSCQYLLDLESSFYEFIHVLNETEVIIRIRIHDNSTIQGLARKSLPPILSNQVCKNSASKDVNFTEFAITHLNYGQVVLEV